MSPHDGLPKGNCNCVNVCNWQPKLSLKTNQGQISAEGRILRAFLHVDKDFFKHTLFKENFEWKGGR